MCDSHCFIPVGARGGVFESKKGESIDALQEELAALFAKYGRSSVISKLVIPDWQYWQYITV